MTKAKILKSVCLIFAFILAAVFISQPVKAQQDTGSVQNDVQGQLESCFKYYDYGKVKVFLSGDKFEYRNGEKPEFSGTVHNQNSFPLRDVVLYAQLKRINSSGDFEDQGHYLTDRMTLLKDLNFLAGEVKSINFSIPIKDNYSAGEYQLAYFIFSKNGFNYAGRNFLEEDSAGVSNFTVAGERSPEVFLDPASLTVNGVSQSIRGSLDKFLPEGADISVKLNQNPPDNAAIPVKYYFYGFDDALDSNLVSQGEQTIGPGDNYTFKTNFNPGKGGAYVFLASIEKPVKSMIKYRFVIDGNDPSPLRMNDLGITRFPADGNARAYLCFHSATDRITPEFTVRLSLYNADGNFIDKKEISGNFDYSVAAISLPLNRLTDHQIFRSGRNRIISGTEA